MKLEDLREGVVVRGLLPKILVTVVNARWYQSAAVELTYRDPSGRVETQLLYRDSETRLEVIEGDRPWAFDGDGALFRLASEANRIRLAHLFDPVLAVHTSLVEPLPHQITAVYEAMLPRLPLRFLLADDPGAGKTIMAGLLIKELIVRGDLRRCLIVCPGSLAEQWQDELNRRFNLPFEIMTNDKLESSRTRNWFGENHLIIARLDKLARDTQLQTKLMAPDSSFDLVVVDEAHKMSASFFGDEIKYTRRYRLGQLLSRVTRHLLLMTATPHNGKEPDFQLFLALLDGDRFEGRFREGVEKVDVTDLMRRMVKENLYRFDGRPLFPERIAHTIPYKLAPEEAELYQEVTDYVRQEFNRAEALLNEGRVGTIGFALTVLQRRMASSSEAVFQSLRRRRERLEGRLQEVVELGRTAAADQFRGKRTLTDDDLEDLEDAPDIEVEETQEEVLDEATAASTIHELRAEIATLQRLQNLADEVRRSGQDTKWRELSRLLSAIYLSGHDPRVPGSLDLPTNARNSKLVIFTEHRDTLFYLQHQIAGLLDSSQAVEVIHGSLSRDDRRKAQERFLHDPAARILLATDAAGEGVNLQRAHLMVNYDLPWNPNRLEQRFGRIHRIGQTEVCYLWNLVAEETREGDVYRTLFDKLAEARHALGGQVFDVLGKLEFEGQSLRDLLIEAIRYGENPRVRARLNQVIASAVDATRLQELLEDRALARDTMDAGRLATVRSNMERAEARRLQPHYVASFFLEAFRQLGGVVREREPRRYEVSHVPATIRNRDRMIGHGQPVLGQYERIVFEKDLVAPPDLPLAAFVCPGHPLLDATLDLTLERHRDLLRRGAILVDERDPGMMPHAVFCLEHALQDASLISANERRTVSKRVLYIDVSPNGDVHHLQYAPYLDYRPLAQGEPGAEALLARPEFNFIRRGLEDQILGYAIMSVVPEHLNEVRGPRLALVEKTRQAVLERLSKEITHWEHRARELRAQELAGKVNAALNSQEARRRAEDLQGRLQKRMGELDLEAQLSASSPTLLGGFVVVPSGLLSRIQPPETVSPRVVADKQAVAARARAIVMEIERRLGNFPMDHEFERLGYDIESQSENGLRFIEVKGRDGRANTLTATRNEILYSFNEPERYILAIVEFLDDGGHRVHYLRQPFRREPDFAVTSVTYDFEDLLARGEPPR